MSTRLKIVFLTSGTGGWFCGACMRDNALAKSLQAAGHQVSLLPMYLPLYLDEEQLPTNQTAPMFFGGINVYLQHKSAIFRHTPEWMHTALDHPRLLRGVARRSHMTSPRDHGELTLAILHPEDSSFGRELDKLIEWLQREPPDILCLSTVLQAGMIRELKRRLGVKIICFFQGEDSFINSLPEPYRDKCWRELALRIRDADRIVSPSSSYADLMRRHLDTEDLEISILPNGINLEGYTPQPEKQGPPVIGYLARMAREKGLEVMVEAFIHLRTVLEHPTARLHMAGAATTENHSLIEAMKQRLATAGLTDHVRWMPNISRQEKAAMLKNLTLFSVPAIYQEAFGLYVIEAMASGIPMVQPASASFPEILTGTGSGTLVPTENPVALAREWHQLLQQPDELRRMAESGRRTAEQFYDINVMRDGFLSLAHQVLSPSL